MCPISLPVIWGSESPGPPTPHESTGATPTRWGCLRDQAPQLLPPPPSPVPWRAGTYHDDEQGRGYEGPDGATLQRQPAAVEGSGTSLQQPGFGPGPGTSTQGSGWDSTGPAWAPPATREPHLLVPGSVTVHGAGHRDGTDQKRETWRKRDRVSLHPRLCSVVQLCVYYPTRTHNHTLSADTEWPVLRGPAVCTKRQHTRACPHMHRDTRTRSHTCEF